MDLRVINIDNLIKTKADRRRLSDLLWAMYQLDLVRDYDISSDLIVEI
jgi:hypothetical protein